MNPAFSVILFTTLSGIGYGMLMWLGLAFAVGSSELFTLDDPEFSKWLFMRIAVLLATGVGLTTIGLVSSTFHLGKPMRAWRALSQWRTSWLSREGVLALLTYVPAVALTGLVLAVATGTAFVGPSTGQFGVWLGSVLASLSFLTIVCTAMIYASLKPVPSWRHPLVVPAYLVFALLTGLIFILALSALASGGPLSVRVIVTRGLMVVPAGLVVVLAAMKIVYWRAIDRIELPSREAATALEGIGKVTVFERPHTEANYLTHEMGFVLARKHSHKLRAIALLLFAGVPLFALLIAMLLPAFANAALWIATLGAFAGAFVERWLFFAEAKHMMMLYY